MDRAVEQKRHAVQPDRAEAEEGQEPVRVGDCCRLEPAERPRLEHEAGEHRRGQQYVGGQAARPREEPERGSDFTTSS